MLHDSGKDYQQQKAAAIMEMAEEKDLVITAGNPVFERYLRYQFSGEVLYLYALSSEQLAEAAFSEPSGRIYLLGDVFKQSKSLRVRFPEKTNAPNLKNLLFFGHAHCAVVSSYASLDNRSLQDVRGRTCGIEHRG